MSAKHRDRTAARRAAVQLLYTAEIQNEAPSALLASGRCLSMDDGPLPDYALELVQGVEDNREQLDERIEATSENWRMSRMPLVDKSILRLAAYEMLFVDKVPVSVAINEAVELAKEFGGEDESHRFVNGVLGRIAQSIASPASCDGASGEAAESGGAESDAAAGLGEEEDGR